MRTPSALLVTLLGLFPIILWATEGTPAGVVERVEGKVTVLDPRGALRLTLSAKDQEISFYEAETLESAAASRAKLRFADQSQILLEPGTSLTVRQASMGAEKIIRQQKQFQGALNRGKMRVEINQRYANEKGEKFEVHTPNAVAGVRGTIFILEYQGERTTLQVIRGRVHFARAGQPGGEFIAGQTSEIAAEAQPTLKSRSE